MEMHNQTVIIVGIICVLLIISSFTKLISKYTKIPFTILLVLVGFLLSIITQHEQSLFQPLTNYTGYPDILLFVCLPTLIFEAAFTMNGRLLRQNLLPVLTLAVPGLFVSTTLIGIIVSAFTPLHFLTALLLGAILSATDSVAVIAIFRQLGVPKRLSIIVEGESLFNSSTGFVVAKTLLFVILATNFTTKSLIWNSIYQFCWNFFGGILVGGAATFLTGYFMLLMEEEMLIVVSLTVILAYLSFILAEKVFGVSGVMATITAGVLMADWGKTKFSATAEKSISNMLAFLSYIVNSLIFLLVGFTINPTVLIKSLPILCVVIIAMLIARGMMVFGLIPLLSKLPGALPINWRYQTITWWGGIQGAIGLTMVLGLSNLVPDQQLLVSLVMGAVIFTIIVQGSVMVKLIHWLKLDRPPLSDRLATITAEIEAENITLARIPALQSGGLFSMNIAKNLQRSCEHVIQEKTKQLHYLKATKLSKEKELKLLFLSCLAEEKYLYYDMLTKGHISEEAYRILDHKIDMEIDSVRYQGKIIKKKLSYLKRFFDSLIKQPIINNITNSLHIHQSITDYEVKWAEHQGCITVLEHLKKLVETHEIKNYYLKWFNTTRYYLNEVAEQFPEFVKDMQMRFAKRLLLQAKAECIINQVHQGLLPTTSAEKITKKYSQQLQKLKQEHPEKLKLDPKHLLTHIPFFKMLSENELNEIIKHLKEYHAVPGDTIIHQGEVGDSLYIITRGVVRVIKDDKEIATLMAGDFFGEQALLRHVKRTAACKAITPCILYILRQADFEMLMDHFPLIRQIVMEEAKKRE